jgi:hypothetical protein
MTASHLSPTEPDRITPGYYERLVRECFLWISPNALAVFCQWYGWQKANFPGNGPGLHIAGNDRTRVAQEMAHFVAERLWIFGALWAGSASLCRRAIAAPLDALTAVHPEFADYGLAVLNRSLSTPSHGDAVTGPSPPSRRCGTNSADGTFTGVCTDFPQRTTPIFRPNRILRCQPPLFRSSLRSIIPECLVMDLSSATRSPTNNSPVSAKITTRLAHDF